ncbi:MAG: hypothetical protein ACSHX0_10075 [Akkermansiaceae bacterium]
MTDFNGCGIYILYYFLLMLGSINNPFEQSFCRLGEKPQVTTDCVNADALETLTKALMLKNKARGKMVLLRSPRAGFGKTHLLELVRQRISYSHEFIGLEPLAEKSLDSQCVMNTVMRSLSRRIASDDGITVLDYLSRRIFALALTPLVKSGSVPSHDRDEAITSLKDDPIGTFNFHDESAVTAQWTMSNFTLLQPKLATELSYSTKSSVRALSWWVGCLFKYSASPADQPDRNDVLFQDVFYPGASVADMHEHLVVLLKLLSLVVNPVLVLDGVDGYFGDPESALKLCAFLSSLHQSCDKLSVVVSVNSDVWETAFVPRLSSGLKDRLTDTVIDLKSLSREEAKELIHGRAGDQAHQIVEAMDLDIGVTYARGVIKKSAVLWEELALGENKSQDDEDLSNAEPISLLTPQFNNAKTSKLKESDEPSESKMELGEKIKAVISLKESVGKVN